MFLNPHTPDRAEFLIRKFCFPTLLLLTSSFLSSVFYLYLGNL